MVLTLSFSAPIFVIGFFLDMFLCAYVLQTYVKNIEITSNRTGEECETGVFICSKITILSKTLPFKKQHKLLAHLSGPGLVGIMLALPPLVSIYSMYWKNQK